MQKGLTLIEILIAIMLITLLSTTSIKCINSGIYGNRNNPRLQQIQIEHQQAKENSQYVSKEMLYDDLNDTIYQIKLKGNLDCIVYDGYKAGGISCNWEKYNKGASYGEVSTFGLSQGN